MGNIVLDLRGEDADQDSYADSEADLPCSVERTTGNTILGTRHFSQHDTGEAGKTEAQTCADQHHAKGNIPVIGIGSNRVKEDNTGTDQGQTGHRQKP